MAGVAVATTMTASTMVALTGSAHGQPTVDWSPCKEEHLAGLDCAVVAVPMDHSRPNGPWIEIAISRLRATDPQRRLGVLFTNPGGPGGPGRGLPTAYSKQPIAEVYDIIGMDPRGTGASTPLFCDLTGVLNVPYMSRPREEDFPKLAAEAEATEDGCRRGGGTFRPFVTTMNTARDMDRIRELLGEKKINYLGVSYGTWLGAVYGQMFPDRLDRSVLDSSMDPGTTWRDQDYDGVNTVKGNFIAWAQWAATRNETFRLGTTPRAVRASIDRVAEVLAARPVGGFYTVTDFDLVVGDSTRYRTQWASFAKNMQRTLAEIDGTAIDPELARSNSRAAAAARALMDEQRLVPGTYEAVLCEWDWPKDLETYYRDMRRVRDTYPFERAMVFVAPTPCTFHERKGEPLIHVGKANYPQGLVLAADGDSQTPLVNGQAMARTLGHTLIAVRNEGQHGQYSLNTPNPCVDTKVNAYLINGTLPTSHVDCPTANPPAPIPTDPTPGQTEQIPDLGELAERLAASQPYPVR